MLHQLSGILQAYTVDLSTYTLYILFLYQKSYSSKLSSAAANLNCASANLCCKCDIVLVLQYFIADGASL